MALVPAVVPLAPPAGALDPPFAELLPATPELPPVGSGATSARADAEPMKKDTAASTPSNLEVLM
jgi:hypothetical protein